MGNTFLQKFIHIFNKSHNFCPTVTKLDIHRYHNIRPNKLGRKLKKSRKLLAENKKAENKKAENKMAK